MNGNALLLRSWEDEYLAKERKLILLDRPESYKSTEAFGLDERMVQLEALWSGQVSGYAVIASLKSKAARPRELLGYREDAVFPLTALELRNDGTIAALVGKPVPIASLVEHSKAHRTSAGDGPFPFDDSDRSGLSTDSYKAKIPAIRAWLIDAAAVRGTVTYAQVMNTFALTFFPLRHVMNCIGQTCREAGEPIITSLIIHETLGHCSSGLFTKFKVVDDIRERERCYAHWSPIKTQVASTSPALTHDSRNAEPSDEFASRLARFTEVETRPQQSKFREAVFRAYDGRCAVSGCRVPEALEAAHLEGRHWRQGHNSARDGILLRRDLHRLYDRGLLKLSGASVVELAAAVLPDYAQFDGITIAGRTAHDC